MGLRGPGMGPTRPRLPKSKRFSSECLFLPRQIVINFLCCENLLLKAFQTADHMKSAKKRCFFTFNPDFREKENKTYRSFFICHSTHVKLHFGYFGKNNEHVLGYFARIFKLTLKKVTLTFDLDV
jgi:hypothetical protein